MGSTTRSMKTREAEHQREVRKANSNTWVGKGKSFKTTSGFWSKNARKAKKEAIVMGDDKVKNNDEEEEERAGEEKTSGNWKWKEMLFGLLLFLVFFILPSWYSGDWSSGWKYRSI